MVARHKDGPIGEMLSRCGVPERTPVGKFDSMDSRTGLSKHCSEFCRSQHSFGVRRIIQYQWYSRCGIGGYCEEIYGLGISNWHPVWQDHLNGIGSKPCGSANPAA